jgi:hypothetical protein
MATYLEDHPPARTQFHRWRRAEPTGCIVVHTAESILDLAGDDSGAESVARFISRRTDAAGSYHLIGDRDSIIHLIPFGWEAFGDGTGSNPYAIHISLAMRAADWPHLSAAHRVQLVGTAVAMADMAAAWLEDVHGITVPARRITRAESNFGESGFISHAERDPGRRTDPGPGFPWAEFLDRYAHSEGVPMPPPPIYSLDDAMSELLQVYQAYRTDEGAHDEMQTWRPVLARKLYADGGDLRPELVFAEWALRNPDEADKL